MTAHQVVPVDRDGEVVCEFCGQPVVCMDLVSDDDGSNDEEWEHADR